VWVLTQQIVSIAKHFLEVVAVIVPFYIPSSKTMKAMHIPSNVPATKPVKNQGPVHAGKKLPEHNRKAHKAKNKLKRQQQTKRLLCRMTNHPLTSKKGSLASKFFPPGESASHLLGRTTIERRFWLQLGGTKKGVEEKPKGNATLEAKLNGVLTPVTTMYNRSGPKKIGFTSKPSINFKKSFF